MADPRMLRVYEGKRVGSTAFFRNRIFLQRLCELLSTLDGVPKLLFHACSIGAEPYSFAATAADAALKVEIDATDIEPEFLRQAKAGEYDASIIDGMSPSERRWFQDIKDGCVRVSKDLRRRVTFLDPMSVLELPPSNYDVVLAMNVLVYVTADQQRSAIQTMAAKARRFLCLTAFHPDTIKADVSMAGFEPVLSGQKEIHDGWLERRKPAAAALGAARYCWVLPPYDDNIADAAWRFGSIFQRAAKI